MGRHVCLALIVCSLCAAVDVMYVVWTSSVQQRHAMGAVLAAAGIQFAGIVAVLFVVDERWLLAFNVLGHAAGSYIGVRLLK